MAHDVAQVRRRNKYTPLLVLAGFLACGAVQHFMENGVVSVKPPPRGYTYRRPHGEYPELLWTSLKRARWPDRKERPAVPAAIRALDGKPVRTRGFLLPLHNANAASEFFIAINPGGCPFCNPYSVADLVLVRMKSQRKLEICNLPMNAYGTLRIATGGPTDQALYTIEDAVLVISQ